MGLAFKANTDDIRYSPAIDVINILQDERAHIKAYDPKAMQNMHNLFPNITYCLSAEQAVEDVDAIIIMTEWPEFKNLNLKKTKQLMKQPVIVDARNILDAHLLQDLNYTFATIGNGMQADVKKADSTTRAAMALVRANDIQPDGEPSNAGSSARACPRLLHTCLLGPACSQLQCVQSKSAGGWHTVAGET